MEEPLSALEHLRRGMNPITAVKIQQRQMAEYRFVMHLQSTIKDAIHHVSPHWNESLQALSERLAVNALQRMKRSVTIEECEHIFDSYPALTAAPLVKE